MPTVMICFTLFQSLSRDPSLYLVSASLLVMKTMEFSARRILDELASFSHAFYAKMMCAKDDVFYKMR